MKLYKRPILVAVVFLLVHINGTAMSLGQSSGSVVFGRPIDLTIQARLDGPLEESSNCFSAEVFQGDTRFDGSRIRLDVKAAANPLEASIRIRSTAIITEPWAKVILRSNCGTKISRQYDFLTDFIADLSPSMPNARLPVVASTAREMQETATALPPLASPTSAPVVKSTAAKNKVAKSVDQKSAKPTMATAKSSTDDAVTVASSSTALRTGKLKSTNKMATKAANLAPEGKSRLKMETFDLADEHQVMLKMSTALISPMASDTPANAQALAQAAAVWRALNAKPEELAADAQKLQATAAELQSVKNNALKAQASLQERLRVAEQKEFSNPLVYGLLALLALALAGLTWMWLRVRKHAQAGYAWLGDEKIAPAYAETLSGTHAAEPVFVETQNMMPAKYVQEPVPVFVPDAYTGGDATEDASAPSMEETHALQETQEMQDASSATETLSASMVFTKPLPKIDVHIDNNPLWPADAASATHSDGPAALVIMPTDAFMLPVTQPDTKTEPEQQVTPEAALVQFDLPGKATVAPPETLNLDLDFSKISPPARKKVHSPVDNHIEFYTDNEHAKAGLPEQHADHEEAALTNERKLKSPPKLPKSVQKPHKPASSSVSDHKSNLIDFESFANPPAPKGPSRFSS